MFGGITVAYAVLNINGVGACFINIVLHISAQSKCIVMDR